jgi:hypothetical protein
MYIFNKWLKGFGEVSKYIFEIDDHEA